ncbi:sporulation integral membrane protein YtvI [Clostridium sp. AM58-1XD]|uniref:sporulation integral membrane protein YtvI n=1 Tax=Clostridium sp. AM58-1XD TaxID=2292307 RepID=UPI000E4C1E30|nr:sporulation integral membrane protein YtvI [Clostridium sp. AM58-1XD]RGY96091.1 sporulation integral membrane protein YtvI [Clostridium sp. AM58-1XD]
MDSVKKYTRVLLNIIIPLAGICLVVFAVPRLLKFFMPFVIGWVLAMIANPLVRFLEKRVKMVRKHSSMVIVIVVLAAVIGLIYLILSRLAIEAGNFARDLPALFDNMLAELKNAFDNFENLFLKLSPERQRNFEEFSSSVEEYISIAMQKIASPTMSAAGHVAKGIPKVLVSVVVTILSSYFFIVERDRIITFWKQFIPESGIRYYTFLKENIKKLIGGYFLAQFRIMFVVAAILAVGFLILQIKYALLWAVLIAILDFLPIFGTGTALFPWAAVKLFSGEYAFAAGLVLLYVLTQVVRQIIQPKIVGDTIGMPPLLTLVFLYLGFRISGIGGMILAVPIGMLALNLYEFGAFDSLIDNLKILVHDINEFRKKE